jgi:segregation and condensation protein A
MLYKQYKEACSELHGMENERALKTERGNIQRELAEIAMQNSQTEELVNLSLFQLLNTFQKVLKRFDEDKNKVHHRVRQYPYSIVEQRSFITDFIRKKEKASFTDLLLTCENKVHAIFSFLALLELLQEQILRITLGEGFNNFWLSEASSI